MSEQAHYDVFISHASEDKDAFVRSLAAELVRLGLRVWYDEMTLKLGDSLRKKIDEGLASSNYGVVILSRAFFSKNWPQAELDALFAREMLGRKVILPVWHHIGKEEVLNYSPLLAGKLAAHTSRGAANVAQDIFATVRPNAALPRGDTSRQRPRQNTGKPLEPLTELLRTMEAVTPLLHKLDEVLIGRDARIYLQALQYFFQGGNMLTEMTDKNLRFAADTLLRVLASDGLNHNYMREKLGAFWACAEDFRERAKIGRKLSGMGSGSEPIYAEIGFFYTEFLPLTEDASTLPPADKYALRLIIALLEYGRKQHPDDPEKRFPQITSNIHRELREYLAETFRVQFNAALPDTLEEGENQDMRYFCDSHWESLVRNMPAF